jgi:hypothetical protein
LNKKYKIFKNINLIFYIKIIMTTKQDYGFYSSTQINLNRTYYIYYRKGTTEKIFCTEINSFYSEKEALKYAILSFFKDMKYLGPVGKYINRLTWYGNF